MGSSGSDHPATGPSPLPTPAEAWADWLKACWNEVGVHGNKQCVRLQEYAHCRHCPVYSAAGARFLDRPLPSGYRSDWAAYFGGQKDLREPGNISAMLFRLGSEWLALPTQVILEVVERRQVHSLPGRQDGALLGVANVRGELLVCVSLGQLLGLERTPSAQTLRSTHSRMLVGSWDGSRFVFPVNEVSGPHRFGPHELKPLPTTLVKAGPSYAQSILQWQNQPVGLLDPAQLYQNLKRSLA